MKRNRCFGVFGLLTFGVLIFAALTLVACQNVTQPYATRSGMLRDYIFSVENLNNGAVRMWMRNDNLAAYCITDQTMANQAKDIIAHHAGEVLVTYRSIRAGDADWPTFNLAGCGTYSGTNASSFEIYKVQSIEAVPGRDQAQ